MEGVIARLNKNGFGFITGKDKKDYFFHNTVLKNIAFDDLEPGMEVTFEDAETDRGLRAEDVYV